jgi:hypothetical protein
MQLTADNRFPGYRSRFVWLAVFAVAMGFLEAIVVIYLREIYYPDGFDFPLKLMSSDIIAIEWIRELATLVMLAGISIIAGRNNLQRLFYFLFVFGVWDIFYYAALKLLIGWPASLMTWDLLFLIPASWAGPVLAPVICSAIMIIMSLLIIIKQEKDYLMRIRLADWLLILGGAVIILYTFLADYSRLIVDSGVLASKRSHAGSEQLMNMISNYVPDKYSWLLFVTGIVLVVSATVKIMIQNRKHKTYEELS